MKTIVAPVNFTDSSDNAARYAADMALAMEAELHLIHFVEIPVSTGEMPMNPYVLEGLQASGTEGLNQLWDELVIRTKGKVTIYTNMETGNVEHRLEEFCAAKKPFIVVMGSSGPSLERMLRGSNLSVAIRRLHYPLIVVPDNVVFHQIKKVVVACDLEDIAAGVPVSVAFLKQFQDIFGASFDVINIATGTQDHLKEAEAAFMFNSWKDRLQELYPEIHFVRGDNVEEGINSYLGQHPADLILVFPKKHGLFEFHKSHAKKIAHNSRVPVMSIHP
jgi:nucleotide-binding universal stress UspA family protein